MAPLGMPPPLSPKEALDHFLGFDSDLASVVSIEGRAPWHVPPTVDRRKLTFEGIDGEAFVDPELQGVVRLKRGAKGDRLGDYEVELPPLPVPQGFTIREGALGWIALRDLRQFLREVFPRDSGPVVAAPSAAQELIDDRNEFFDRLSRYFQEHPDGCRGVRDAARLFLRGDRSAEAALYGTLRALRAQIRAELPDEEEIYYDWFAQEDEDRMGVLLPKPLEALAVRVGRERRSGRPPTTSIVVEAGKHYRLKPRDVAMLVGLERDAVAPFEGSYANYFEPKGAKAASDAWRKIFYRRA